MKARKIGILRIPSIVMSRNRARNQIPIMFRRRQTDDSETELQEEKVQTSATQTSNDMDREERPPERKSFLRTYLPFFQ